jgi:hypothetical protein
VIHLFSFQLQQRQLTSFSFMRHHN